MRSALVDRLARAIPPWPPAPKPTRFRRGLDA